MPHNPVKSIKIDFHSIDGVTPKPAPVPSPNDTGGGMEKQAAPQPQTKLSPLEETLFPHWATANGVSEDVHGAPDNHYDFRGMYKQTGGAIHPPGALAGAAEMFNRLKNNPMDMNKLIQPVASHGDSHFTTPGSPDMASALAQKSDIMSQEQDQSNSDPLRSLINMIGLGR